VRRCFLLLLAACSEPIDASAPGWHPIADKTIQPRWGQTAIWDPSRDRMVVFGGDGDQQRNDLWALDLESYTWHALPSSNGPGPRTDLAGFYDRARDRLVIVGGRVGFAQSIDEVWAYSFATSTWDKLPSGPPARHDVPGTTDGMTKGWVFGGAGAFLQSLNDLWELDLATNTWRELPDGGVRPAARTSGALVYMDGALYITGGHDAISVQREAWRYDLSASKWEKLSVSGDPIGGAHFGYAADTTCGSILLSAGDNLDNYDVGFTDQLFVRGAPHYAVIPASVMPPARDHPSMILDGKRRRLVLFGGGTLGDGLGFLGDTWVLPIGACP